MGGFFFKKTRKDGHSLTMPSGLMRIKGGTFMPLNHCL